MFWKKEFVEEHLSEIVFFLFKMGESMLDPTVRNYVFEGVCLDLYGSQNITEKCGLKILERIEEGGGQAIQSAASSYLMANKFLMNFPALLLGFFCGSWSDTVGRRIPILISVVATAAASFLYAVSMIIDATGRGIPVIPLVLVGALIRGVVGKAALITMAVYSLICDHSSKQNRTKKIGRLLSMYYFGYVLGSLMAGSLLQIYGFHIIFSSVFFINIACIAIVIIFMDRDEKTADKIGEEENDEEVDKPLPPTGFCHHRMMPFKLKHLFNSIQVLTKKRDENQQFYLLVFLFLIFAYQTCKSGESEVIVQFAEAPPLDWQVASFVYFQAFDYGLLGITTLIILPLLIRFFKLADSKLIFVGIFFKVIRLLTLSCSKSSFEIIFSTLIGCPSGLILSCCKATVSKIISDHERGKIFALISCAETVAILLGSLIFGGIYKSTKNFFSGTVFILEALFFCSLLGLVFWLMKVINKGSHYETVDLSQKPGNVSGEEGCSFSDPTPQQPQEVPIDSSVSQEQGDENIFQKPRINPFTVE